MGRRVPEAAPRELRELLVDSYRVIYQVAGEQVQILTVIHGSRDVARLLDR
jgi:plasmid stabilization system protein ParE